LIKKIGCGKEAGSPKKKATKLTDAEWGRPEKKRTEDPKRTNEFRHSNTMSINKEKPEDPRALGGKKKASNFKIKNIHPPM